MTVSDLAKHRFMEACKTAELIDIAGEKAIVIDGHIIDVRASVHAPESLLDWLVEALRGGKA